MKRTLHKLSGEALEAYSHTERVRWILEWPGQLVLNCSQVCLAHIHRAFNVACPSCDWSFKPHFISSGPEINKLPKGDLPNDIW